ncbi:MAG: flagellar filament capping protein FliD [Provencibacterium sp.]|jgi:flagellar hook-associated protein 2|nr:flagellar filament capping protein FliD [Provencibacterium sp.]
MKIESSSSSYVNGNYSSKGFSGLASGLDTESMVQELLSGTQAKIDKQTGLKQQLEWKQDLYRDIIKDLLNFKNKYFDRVSSTGLNTNALYNAMSAICNSSAVKALATTNAAVGTTRMEVAQLATNTVVKSSGRVSGALAGDVDLSQLKREVAFDVTVDGTKKTVAVDLSAATTEEELQSALQDAFTNAGVDVTVSMKDGKVDFTGGTNVSKIAVSSDSTALGLGMIGLTSSSVSSKTNGKVSLGGEVDLDNKLSLNVYLNGVKKTITIDDRKVTDAASLAKELQTEIKRAHGAGITVTEQNGRISLSASDIGQEIYLTGDTAMLDAMGMKAGQSTSINGQMKLKDVTFATPLQGDKFTFTINGKEFSYSGDTMLNDVLADINSSDAGVRITFDSMRDGFSIESTSTGSGFDIEMSQSEGNLLTALFGSSNTFTSTSALTLPDGTQATADSTLADLGIDPAGLFGKGIDADTTLGELAEKSGGRYAFDAATGELKMDASVGSQTLTDAEKALFGDVQPSASSFGQTIEGKNAVVRINGVWTERTTNSFTANGIYFDLKTTTGTYKTDADGNLDIQRSADGNSFTVEPADGAFIDEVVVEVERNTDQIYNKITEFVNDYNEMIEKLNGYLDEDATYKDYAPLTSEQKKEMSEREIELWEEKAKGGLLRRDNAISTFLTQMRQALYERPDGSPIALYDIGIETSSEWRDKGKLEIDETKLRAAIEQNTDAVANLFNNKEGGIATRLNDILYNTANDSSGSPGTLVQIAGLKNRATDTNNELYNRMKKIDEQIERLKNQYSQQKTRYWNQFNAMEQMIAQMNQQSAWLTQQLG